VLFPPGKGKVGGVGAGKAADDVMEGKAEVKFPRVSVIGTGALTEGVLEVAWRLNTGLALACKTAAATKRALADPYIMGLVGIKWNV